MSPAPRSLPIRYAPYPGEALDSWMEAVAARLNCPFTDVLSALGLPNRDPAAAALVLPRWTTLATPDELTAITEATGVPVDVLAAMTLQPYDGHAVVIVAGQRRVHRQLLWGRPGSRFCPACLEETGGRWQVTWRLGWSFACTRHHVLLADRCPACLRSPRLRSQPRREVPRPGLCSSASPGGGPRPGRCHHPLADTPATVLTPGGALEETQGLIDTALAAPDQVVHWPLYGPGGVPLRTALRDVKSLGALVLNHATTADLNPVASGAVLERLELYRTNPLSPRSQRHPSTQRSDLHSYYAPDDAAATAVAIAAALRILCAAHIRAAADAARWLTDRVAASGRALYPAGVVSVGGTLSPVLEAALRCSRESQIMPVYRLRHRTAIHSTRAPVNHDARAGRLLAGLWPEWALRLSPRHSNGRPVAKRTDELLAVACLLVGNTTSIQAATRQTGTDVTSHNVSTLLAEITRRSDCADVLHALILLADHLDQHGAPIDYARRRALFTKRARFIDPSCWSDLQRRLRSTHAPDVAHAQRWIFHPLTGSPPHLAHPGLAPAPGAQRQQYQRFRWRILPAEADLLTHTAQELLDEHGIDEPLQWTPRLPARVLRHLALPGPDPDSITVAQLHRAVPGGDFSIAQLARTLNTTTAHVICLLSQHPADWSPPRFRRTQHTATRLEQWRIWYERDHLSLQAIADREGISLATVRLAFLKNGVRLRLAGSYPGRPRRK
ncbi:MULTISPECIES: TniQ family protein [Streptomyces]|uniref:TniQ family protein n=1 Tax=Streptomyces TaxID=1883 RepID=UPI001CCD491E|nr:MULTISPECIES: TniQ family protein [Streptomyces]